ncbi:MAG: glycosyltransferase family 39 protein [Myxococcota bacterium]
MTPEAARTRPTRGMEWAALLLLVAFVTLPFAGKPFHVDDTFFLRVTEAIVADPLDPYGGELDWWDRPLPLFDIDSNPPGLNYYLAPVASVTNFSELALHLAMIPFFALFAVSVWSLARRFTRHPMWSVAFVMTSAGVVVSGNVMRDIPSAALGVGAVAAAVAGTDRDDRRLWLLGGLLAGTAILTKYSALLLLPLLAAYPILAGKPRHCAWIAVPVGLLGLWFLHNLWIYGEVHFLGQLGRGYTSPGHGWRDNLCGLPVVAGSLLYLLPVLAWRSAATGDRLALAGALASGLACWGLVQWYMVGGSDAQYLFWATTGGALLFVCGLSGVRGSAPLLRSGGDRAARDSLFLLLWLLAPLLLSVLFVPFQAVRHFLPALAPCVLLAFRHLE